MGEVSNPQNKTNLCDYLSESFCLLGRQQLPPETNLVIAGGFENGRRAVIVRRGHCEDVDVLESDHEEADTRLLLHAKYVADTYPACRIVLQSPDTDVLSLSVSHFSDIDCT